MFGSYRQSFEDDSFFEDYPSDKFIGTDDLFSSGFDSEPRYALTNGSSATSLSSGTRPRHCGDRDHERGSRALMTTDPFHSMSETDPFHSMSAMMSNIHDMMGNMSLETRMKGNEDDLDPDSHIYSRSSVSSYSKFNGGQPKIYQASTASRQMPGGNGPSKHSSVTTVSNRDELRETRKSIRDSDAGLEKMAIGRHIRERGNMITRQRNTRTGDFDENKDYINMEETDLPQFDDEWREKTRRYYGNMDSIGQYRQHEQQPSNYKALGFGKCRHRKQPDMDLGFQEHKHRHSKYM